MSQLYVNQSGKQVNASFYYDSVKNRWNLLYYAEIFQIIDAWKIPILKYMENSACDIWTIHLHLDFLKGALQGESVMAWFDIF